MAASLLLATLYVVMSLYIPILVGNAIDCIIDAGRVDFAAMWGYLRNVAICAAVAALAQWLMNQINNRMTYGVTRDIRNEAFRHIQVLPLSYLDKQPQRRCGQPGDRLTWTPSPTDCSWVLPSCLPA